MTEGMTRIGEVEVASDGTTSTLVATPGTQTNTAVQEVASAAAVQTVADAPAVVEAAAVRAQSDAGLVRGQTTDEDAFTVRFKGAPPFVRATEADGITSKITHQEDSVPPEAITTMLEIPDESSYLCGFFGNNGRAILAKRTNGIVDGLEAYQLRDTSPIVFDAVGDSTTFGAGVTDDDAILTADTWVAKLSVMLGYPVYNWGASGARADELTARIGGLAPLANVAGNTIPASGPVNLENMTVLPLAHGYGSVSQYDVELVLANGVRVPGVLKRVSETLHSFTRLDAGAPITVPGLVEVVSLFGKTVRARRLILGMGINNKNAVVAGTQTLADLKRWYSQATTGLTHRPLVWGVLDRGPSEGPGTVWGDTIRQLEAWLVEKYGADYAPFRQYLATQRALDDAKVYNPAFTPSADDLAAIAVGTVPPSFRVTPTTVHLNALGHSLQAGMFRNHIISKGLS
jgi:hypothetical protein